MIVKKRSVAGPVIAMLYVFLAAEWPAHILAQESEQISEAENAQVVEEAAKKKKEPEAELGLESAPGPLSDLIIPEPKDLSKYIKNRDKAIVLGKALFWDMQVGSDGRTACASCHFHAGTDSRPRNTLSPKGAGTPRHSTFHGANYTLQPSDFPFHKFADDTDRKSPVVRTTSEVVGAQGVVRKNLISINEGNPVDTGNDVPDPVFNVNGTNTRQVEPRQSPTIFNAVFNDRQFWDGRANRFFNGVNPFGDTDDGAVVYKSNGKGGEAKPVKIKLDNASLASQAVGPGTSSLEMSWSGRSFPVLGRKMLSLAPLALQRVDRTDSVLGPYATSSKGLKNKITYASLIRDAFKPQWWDSTTPVLIEDQQFTHMEVNFSLFWGLAIQLYESTLVSDQSPFDEFRRGDSNAISDTAKKGLKIFLNEGKCINCHKGPAFAGGTVHEVRSGDFKPDKDALVIVDVVKEKGKKNELIEKMEMGDGKMAVYDNGFYNIGVTPTEEDLGVGGEGPFGPFSLARRRQLGDKVDGAVKVKKKDRLAIHGSFRAPTLRNIELTGPYFHNGGKMSLQQVVEFYARGGDFRENNMDDLDPDIDTISKIVGNHEAIAAVVAFLKTLTDPRVEYQKAPFDHPELLIVNGHVDVVDGVALDDVISIPAVGAAGGEQVRSFEETLPTGGPN